MIKKINSFLVSNFTIALLISIFLVAFTLRILSAVKMGWLAEDVFFVDFIEKWFAHNFWDYFFQFNHDVFPPRSPEFGTPPLGMWVQTIGVYLAERFGFSELFGARMMTIIFSQIGLYYVYKIGKEFFNTQTGLLAAFFVATTPSIIAIDSSAHVDTFLYVFLIATIFYVLKFIRTEDYANLYIASFIAGLAVLVKVYAWVIIGFLGVVLFVFFIKNKFQFRHLIFSTIIVLLLPIVLWAGFRDLDHIKRTFEVVEKIGSFSGSTGTGGMFSEYDGVLGYDKKSPLYNFAMILGRNLPLVGVAVFLLIPVWLSMFFRKKRDVADQWLLERSRLLVVATGIILLHFASIYFLAGPNAVFNRILFPSILYILIAAVSLQYFISKLSNAPLRNFSYLAIVSVSLLPVFTTSPHLYNAYNNLLVGGTSGGSKIYRVGHGEGLELVGEYLNRTAPGNSFVYAPRTGFISKYLRPDITLSYAPLNKSVHHAFSQGSDYVVLHNSFFSGGLKPVIGSDLENSTTDFSINIGGYQYIKVYKLDSREWYEKLNRELDFHIDKISTKTKISTLETTPLPNGELGVRYDLKNRDYAYVHGRVLIDQEADGIFVTIDGRRNNPGDNLYVDIGLDGVGYYRQYMKFHWKGEHTFFISFAQMENKYGEYNIRDSNYLKFSVDSSRDQTDGNFVISNLGWFKYKK